MLVIDCHAHIYSPDERRYPPRAEPMRPPAGKGSVEDLRHESLANGVHCVRAVHTVSFYDYDNRYLADVAKRADPWLAGVCTLDPDQPHAPDTLRQLLREFNVKTLRSIPSRREDTFDSAGVRALWTICREEGATIDIFLMQPKMIESASKLLAEFDSVTVGFCHCMDLKVGPDLEENTALVCGMARFPNLIAKVDFISTGTQMGYPSSDLHDAARQVIRAFGPDRCVWGSNYPNAVWTPKLSYSEHLKIFQQALRLSDEEKRWILGETARRAWFPHIEPEA